MKKPVYADLSAHGEDVRIDAAGRAAMHHKKIVGIIVDDVPGKPERYIEKLKQRFPGITVIGQWKGPTAGAVLIKVGPPSSGDAAQQHPETPSSALQS